MQFSDLQLSPSILKAVANEGYTVATPIQAQAIPHILAGRDVLGCAQTGTGKTAAFALPILDRLAKGSHVTNGRRARALVLCPTRELAAQIVDSFTTYGKTLNLKHTSIYGGVSQGRQVEALRRGLDIIVATPGRLMDLMEQRHVDLSSIEVLILDEADRMLDMGFIQPIRRIVSKIPQGRQTLLFSATMPPEIRRFADSLLTNPAVVNVAPVATTAAKIEEAVYRVEKRDKPALLSHLVRDLPMYRTIVFTKTKHGADRVVKQLHADGIKAEAIHGNKSQAARQRALANFAANKIPVLVATDIASRGIDVDGITHVLNYDLTHEPETYVHRIGRTGRAGASGMAVSFCDREEVSNLKAIERLIRRSIPPVVNPLPASAPETSAQVAARRAAEGPRDDFRQNGRGGGQRGEQRGGRGDGQGSFNRRAQASKGQGNGGGRVGENGGAVAQKSAGVASAPRSQRAAAHAPAAQAPRAAHPLRSGSHANNNASRGHPSPNGSHGRPRQAGGAARRPGRGNRDR